MKNPYTRKEGALPKAGPSPLFVTLVRGGTVESIHRVHAVISDAGNAAVHSWGNPELVCFPRSSVKPLQALAYLSEGLHERYKLGKKEIALSCASHHGEKKHTDLVSAWLARLGLGMDDLACGVHEPAHKESAITIYEKRERPCPIHNNCSGKHSAMLMGCQALSLPTKGYEAFDHPWQERVRKAQSEVFGFDLGKMPWAVDGCGIPTYAVSLRRLALAFAKFADPSSLVSEIRSGVLAARDAMSAEPFYLGGSESLCSFVTERGRGDVFAKLGAEGVYAAASAVKGIGLAIKAECGSQRAAAAALVSLLPLLGMDTSSSEWLRWRDPDQKRWSGENVGQLIVGEY